MEFVNSIKGRLAEIESEMTSIEQAADTNGGLFTAEQQTKLTALDTERAELQANLDLRGKITAVKQGNAQTTRVVDAARPARSLTMGSPWKTIGQFAMDVRAAATNPGAQQKIMNAASTFSSEGTNADGGYAVPQDLRRNIEQFVFGQDSLLSRCDIQRSFSTTMVFPRDLEQDWQLSTTGSYVAEGADYPENKVGVGNVSVSCGKVGMIINATEELVNDALAFDSYLASKGARGLTHNINKQIVSGSGANNLPTGFLNHAALKVVAKEAGQASGTLVANNVQKMYFGMPQMYRTNGIWLVSDTVEEQLPNLTLSGTSLFIGPGAYVGAPDTGKLMGRPVIVSPQMKTLGLQGDIAFVDLSKYLALVKSDIQTSFTPYLYWKSDTLSWKLSIRLGGRPWFDAPITLADGVTTRSPFVTLAAR